MKLGEKPDRPDRGSQKCGSFPRSPLFARQHWSIVESSAIRPRSPAGAPAAVVLRGPQENTVARARTASIPQPNKDCMRFMTTKNAKKATIVAKHNRSEEVAPWAHDSQEKKRLSQLEEQYCTQRLGPVKGVFFGRGNFDPLAATNRGKPNKTGWRDAYFEKHRGQPRVRVKDCGSRFHTVLEAAEHIIKMNEVSRQASAAVAAVKATPGAAPAAPVPVAALIAPEAAPTLAEERIPPPPVLSRNITKPTDFPWSLLSQELTAMPVQRVIPILSNCIPIASLLLTHRACSMLAEPFASGIANGGKGFEFKSKEGLTALLQKKSDGWCALYASKGEDKDQKLAKFKAHMLMRDPTLNGTTLPTGVLLGLIRYVDN